MTTADTATASASVLRSRLRDAAQAPNTKIAYDKAWRAWAAHCEASGIDDPLAATAAEIVHWFALLATEPSARSGKLLSIGTIAMYRSGLSRRYASAGFARLPGDREVRETIAAAQRLRGTPPRQVKALREHEIAAMIEACTCTCGRGCGCGRADSLIGARNAAILAVGFAAALRRSEIIGLTVDDIQAFDVDGERRMTVRIKRSKTDQSGRGHRVPVPDGQTIRPVRRVVAWIERAAIADQPSAPLFQSARKGGTVTGRPLHHSDIARLVKQYAEAIGLDPAQYAAHSLRSGFVTSAAVHRARLDKIMEVTRHKSTDMVMRYIRDADVFADHAGAGFL